MYRLAATPFLEANMAVAVVGYRTYPDGNAQDQVDDLEAAAKAILIRYPQFCEKPHDVDEKDWIGVTLMGHSSGAHISLLMAVQRVERYLDKMDIVHHQSFEVSQRDTLHFDKYVGLSGVYDISHHFDYEAGRGVEELSPMKPACGYTRNAFDHFSPALKLQTLLSRRIAGEYMHHQGKTINVDEIIFKLMPDMLLVHGVEDAIVPFTSTSEAGKIIRSCGVRCCEERYVVAGHADVAVELMLDGLTRTVVMDWLSLRRKSGGGKEEGDLSSGFSSPTSSPQTIHTAAIQSKL